MADHFLPTEVGPPDFYVAAMGRSGSTMLCNWLSSPPDHLVFLEPFFLRPMNSRLLRIQLRDFGMPASDDEWQQHDETAGERFNRLMGGRLKGRQWALKEVLCEEHFRVLETLAPPKVLITVRNIEEVALSFFEKHRAQDNLDRFSDTWVVEYCRRETTGILEFRQLLTKLGVPHRVVRYEDFTQSESNRASVAEFVGWPGGGATGSHFAEFDRAFEIERHGVTVSAEIRTRIDRNLGYDELRLSKELAKECADYQSEFDYC